MGRRVESFPMNKKAFLEFFIHCPFEISNRVIVYFIVLNPYFARRNFP